MRYIILFWQIQDITFLAWYQIAGLTPTAICKTTRYLYAILLNEWFQTKERYQSRGNPEEANFIVMAGTFPGKRVDGLTIKSKNNQSKMRTLFILKCTNGLMGKWLNIPTFQSSHSTWTFWTTANRFHFMWSNKVVTFARCLHLALKLSNFIQCQITSTVNCNLFELKMPCRSSKPIIFLSFFGYFFPQRSVHGGCLFQS